MEYLGEENVKSSRAASKECCGYWRYIVSNYYNGGHSKLCMVNYIQHCMCSLFLTYVIYNSVLMGYFGFQKWPKQKSKIRRYFSYQFWGGHLKHVESRFGSSVVSYFVFLRWLFYMNILIFVLWFSTICTPQIILYAYQGLNRSSEVACVYKQADSEIACSNNSNYSMLLINIKGLKPYAHAQL